MKTPHKAPRIQDVAKLAGVSTATVSRVLSSPSIVSETTRKTVEEAIAQTGYVVNVTARNLRQQQVGSVLALVPNIANPFFSEILSGIANVLRPAGLNLLVLDTKATAEQASAAMGSYLNRTRCDGVIVLDGGLKAELFQHAGCPPVVQACEYIEGLEAPRVLANNFEGGRLAAIHLAELGHQRIFHLRGPAENTLTISRFEGFEAGLAEAGLTPDENYLLDGDFSIRSGNEAAIRILAMADKPSAVFCDSDEMAIGLIYGLIRGGLRVPEHLSTVGFDNIQMSEYSLPPLTTIRQRRARIGRYAAKILLAAIGGDPANENIILPVDIQIRESTAKYSPFHNKNYNRQNIAGGVERD